MVERAPLQGRFGASSGAALPDRVVAEYLNYTLPKGRVGFFMPNAPSPSGYLGYSRAANWHDLELFPALNAAQSADDVLAIARHYQLTHAVFLESPKDTGPIGQFQDRYTVPVWRFAGRAVAAIQAGPNP